MTPATPQPTSQSWLRRAGGAVSILVHLGLLGLIIMGSGVKLYDHAPPPSIDVELVPPSEAPPEGLSLPQLDPTPPAETESAQATETPEPPKPEEAPTPLQAITPAPTPAEPAPSPAEVTALSGAPVVEPDVMNLYGDPFLSGGGFTEEKEAVHLKKDIVAAFRAHLKSCLKLPAGVAPADNARIVLRVALKPDGRLAATPALMEAKASPKGPLIMKAAIHALEACQPYGMLPADKYKEWRQLDLEFTPAGFGHG